MRGKIVYDQIVSTATNHQHIQLQTWASTHIHTTLHALTLINTHTDASHHLRRLLQLFLIYATLHQMYVMLSREITWIDILRDVEYLVKCCLRISGILCNT